ncbi:MAG TPA: hypothetical protein VJ742_12200 [Nitrososphaera sp.]|nr:hypothetical protein [Nitrososphaera sp.]
MDKPTTEYFNKLTALGTVQLLEEGIWIPRYRKLFPYSQRDRAIQFIATSPLKRAETFRAGMHLGLPHAKIPGSGWYRYPVLEELANIWGRGGIIRESYDVRRETVDKIKQTLERGGKPIGLPISDDELTTVLRFMTKKGNEATTNQILTVLKRDLGFVFGTEDMGKLDKRLKAIINMRGYGFMSTKGRFKAALYDPNNLEEGFRKMLGSQYAKVVGEQATEGISLVSKSTMMEIVEDLRKRGDLYQTNGMRPQAQELYKQARNLEGMVEAGEGRFNARMMGFDIKAIGRVDKKLMRDLRAIGGGQLKGDFLIGPDDLHEAYGANIITSIGNLKKEVGLTKARLFTLEEQPISKVFVDLQTLSAYPQFFPEEELVKYASEQVAADIQALQRGEFPDRFRKALQEVLDEKPPLDREGIEALERQQAYARNILQGVDTGIMPVNQNRYLMGHLLENYRKHYAKRGFQVPMALRAHVVSDLAIKAAGGESITKDHIGFDTKTGSWVMNTEDMLNRYITFGGFDQDDALVTMLRWDVEKHRLRAISYRQPNALGEFSTFEIRPDDPGVEKILREMDPDMADEYRELLRGYKRSAAQVDDRLQSFFERAFPHMDSSKLPTELRGPRYGATFRLPWMGGDVTFPGMEGLDPRLNLLTVKEDSLGVKARRAINQAIARKNFADVAVEKLQANALMRGHLGQYSNARMVLDSFLSQVQDPLIGPGAFNVVPQESVIDALINAKKLITETGELGVEQLTTDMYRALGFYAAVVAQNRPEIGLDRFLVENRGSRAEIQKGIDFAVELARQNEVTPRITTVEDVLMDLGAEQAHVARIMGHANEMYGKVLIESTDGPNRFSRLANAVIAGTELPEYLTREVFDEDIVREADDFYKFWRNSVREHMGLQAVDEIGSAVSELDPVEDLVRSAMGEQFYSPALAKARADALGYLGNFLDNSGQMTPRLQRVLLAGLQASGQRGAGAFLYHQIGVGEVTNQALAQFQADRGILPAIDDADNLSDKQYAIRMHKAIRERDELLKKSYGIDYLREQEAILRGFFGEKSAARAAEETFVPLGDRIASLKGFMSEGLVKKSMLAMGAIGAIGVVRSLTHKDPAPEDMGGPANLPGGNPYQDMQIQQALQFNNSYEPGAMRGVTYHVRVRGGQDVTNLGPVMEMIAGGTITNTSTYPVRQRPNPAGEVGLSDLLGL